MAENTPEQSPAPAETPAAPSPDDSLKALASEFPIEEQAKSFTATPPTPPTIQFQPQVYTPDPVTDTEGYKRWALSQHQAQEQALSAIREVSSKVSNFERMFQEQKVNADVDRAVGIVNQKLNVHPDYAEALLNVEYSKNPTFKRIFDNREKNPFAYDKALHVLADKLREKVQVRADPQLAENVRAARTSQQTMATTKTSSQMDDWANLNQSEFEKKWRATMQGL